MCAPFLSPYTNTRAGLVLGGQVIRWQYLGSSISKRYHTSGTIICAKLVYEKAREREVPVFDFS